MCDGWLCSGHAEAGSRPVQTLSTRESDAGADGSPSTPRLVEEQLGKEDARSSEQHATREQSGGNDGMAPKFDSEIPFAPCWQ